MSRVLPLFVAMLLCSLPVVASESAHPPLGSLLDEDPAPAAPWWEGDYLTGDWGGVRTELQQQGVDFFLNYTMNPAGNPVGGRSQGSSYTDNTNFGLDLDLEKLMEAHGLSFRISGLNRNGTNLSGNNIGNQFTVQQIYGSQTVSFNALFLEQKLLEDRLSLKAGRFGTGDEFASSPIYWMYMNNGIDGNPQALPVNCGFSSFPAAVWAARVRVDPTPEWFAMAGAYQVTQLDLIHTHGLDWDIKGDDGVLFIGQAGWTPELARRTATVEGRTVSKGMPGHYWVGAYLSPAPYAQFGTNRRAYDAYGFYAHADQMVWQEEPGSDQGIILWTAPVWSPQENIAKLPFQLNAGAVWRGLIPGRDTDLALFGAVYGEFSPDYARALRSSGGGYARDETVFEFAYRIQLTKFAYIQPDLQWIITPGGTGNVPDALVLGAQAGVTF